MARNSQFFARVDAVGRGTKIMISDELGLNAQVRGWYSSVRLVAEAGAASWTIMMGDGSNAIDEDIELGTVVTESFKPVFLPSVYTAVQVDRLI